MTYKALDIANKIIHASSNENAGETISNLKLQKLLYYQQGFHLAYFGAPLFAEDVEAWMYGPVVPTVYDEFKTRGHNCLEFNEEPIFLNSKEELLFNEVMRIYNDFSAIGLMNLTHKESPWKETPTGVGSVISHEKLMVFFKRKIK